ncbi:MAG: endolytic transglycosylase MltG [Candidatus Dojkabacteria bacterium]|nr:endolytic transglycosylase MltG [Candidatus Dojkabacteria bacterium]
MSIRKAGLLSALIIVVLAAAGALLLSSAYRKAAYKGSGEPTRIIDFTIEEGETVSQITTKLFNHGLIDNELFFKFFVRQKGLSSKLQAGSFRIPDNLPYTELTDTLQNAQHPDIWVTIPEGLMAVEIADVLEEAFTLNPENSFKKNAFLELVNSGTYIPTIDVPVPDNTSLEGFLFPDTYRFPPDATAEYVLDAMLGTLRQKVYEPNVSDIERSGYSFHELLTLASILERETRHEEDRRYVADILLRRQESGWALEVDATLLYHFGDWKHVITYEDLQIDSPYNTRKYTGLPPTPIANPGQQAFDALLDPSENPYWFYISDKDGILHYAETLEEHNENITTYLQ